MPSQAAAENTVLVVEDHPVFLRGLTLLLAAEPGVRVVGEAATASRARALVSTTRPTTALVDLTLAEGSGLDLIKDIRALSPETKILVLSMHDEIYYAQRSLSAGALGYCMKEEAVDHLITAIRTVASGQEWLSPRFAERLRRSREQDDPFAAVQKLSDREFEVFSLLGTGLGTAGLSARLNLSAKTVGTHKEKIKSKLGCTSSQSLRLYAVEWQARQGR